jgi:hypothetical protein
MDWVVLNIVGKKNGYLNLYLRYSWLVVHELENMFFKTTCFEPKCIYARVLSLFGHPKIHGHEKGNHKTSFK